MIGFNEFIWELEVSAWESLRYVVEPIRFQERVTQELLMEAENSSAEDALAEIRRVEDIILNHRVHPGTYTEGSLEAVRDHMRGVAATLRAALSGGYDASRQPEEVLRQACDAYRMGDADSALKRIGEVGALMLAGKRLLSPLETEIHGPLREHLRGAKSAALMAALYGIGFA